MYIIDTITRVRIVRNLCIANYLRLTDEKKSEFLWTMKQVVIVDNATR